MTTRFVYPWQPPLCCRLHCVRRISRSKFPRLRNLCRPEIYPTWESLSQYDVPDWFRDAKFGMWAHWGPQCVEGSGDWMARGMYQEGSKQYKYHVENYGHPSEFGFKDILPLFKAERWNPDSIVGLYKELGAKYFSLSATITTISTCGTASISPGTRLQSVRKRPSCRLGRRLPQAWP